MGEGKTGNNIEVEASPTKGFFIYMITRDIQIQPAIVELIDNAIDGARRIRADEDYSGLKIEIFFNKDFFSIIDNCGGIDIEVARKYAFKFGRPEDRESDDGYYTGIFGIGMKRALFKMGEFFSIKSSTTCNGFSMHMDVEKWKKEKKWDFPLDTFDYDMHKMEETGTKIEITKLSKETSLLFASKAFENALISYIEKYRSVETEKGLDIYINGNLVRFANDKLLATDLITPYKNVIPLDDGTIRIVAGITHNGEPQRAGWYVYCNGRLVLYADKTNLTGWGDEYKAYHPSLASFRGYVYFESKNLLALPWNTSKTGIDNMNKMYIVAKAEMVNASNSIFRILLT